MINRELRSITVNTYADTIDTYGQMRTGTPTQTSIQGVVKTYQNSITDSPRYNDVELIVLTKASVTDSNTLTIDTTEYNVLYVIPSSRYNQVLIKKR